MRWLITGGCGFIGSALSQKLVSLGENVTIFDDLSSQVFPVTTGVGLTIGSVQDADHAVQICHGVDYIVHLAANTGIPKSIECPRQDFKTNALGTLNMLEAARHCKVKKFVFASSAAASLSLSPYGASKRTGEAYCNAYYLTYNVKTIALRFTNVYGPGSLHKDSVVARFYKHMAAREIPLIYGDGSQERDYIYVNDVADAIYMAALSGSCGQFDIGTGKHTTLLELSEMMGCDAQITNHHRSGDRDSAPKADVESTRAAIWWEAKTSLEEGLKETKKYYDIPDS